MSGIRVDLSAFKAELKANREKVIAAARPAAQAGAQVIYEAARINAPVSERAHFFHGKSFKTTGQKYGPYKPGNLRDSIYQAFQDKSPRAAPAYTISWNKNEAPYGHMVELGTSRAPAYSFIGKALADHGNAAIEAMKAEFVRRMTQ